MPDNFFHSPPPPGLEARFLEPPGWRWGAFSAADGARLRYGGLIPEKSLASVVILPGRSEFIEKYFETARDLLAHGYAVWIMDWRGQGRSHPFTDGNCQRRRAAPFDVLAQDLHEFVSGPVRRATSAPLVMLAHSMGGAAGLLYLHKYPGIFACAAFSAPMLGLSFPPLPPWAARAAAAIFNTVCGGRYAFGQGDWNDAERIRSGPLLSSDPARGHVHDSWMQANPSLRLQGVTFSWVHQALRACALLQRPGVAASIATPCLFAFPAREGLVDESAARRVARALPYAEIAEIPDAGHEILMEKDGARSLFLEAFYSFCACHAARPDP